MKRLAIAVWAGLLFAWIASPKGLAADWPMYRADAGRSGCTAESLPADLRLRWVYRADAPPQPAWPSSNRMAFDFAFQPIVVDGLVVFGSSADDRVIALDLETGRVRWTFSTAAPVRFAPAGWRDRVFVAGDDGWLYAISLAEGKLLWKRRGGPDDRMCLGNGRMISRWPARGGPVVFDGVVYFAAGIWPSDGIYVRAIDAASGRTVWTNDGTGTLWMPQPHGTAEAASGVSPQGYLAATQERLFVPTGRAVPAAFRRADGALDYYHLQKNHSIGGSRAVVVDRYLANAGCLFERETGLLAARCGRGVLAAAPGGLLQATGDRLVGYHWNQIEGHDRKGQPVTYRGLEPFCSVRLGNAPPDSQKIEETAEELPAIGKLYQTEPRFKEAVDTIPKETSLECSLAQLRPDVQARGLPITPFLAAAYEKTTEVIVAGGEAVSGTSGRVSVVDLAAERPKVRWSHAVEGAALGLAVCAGRLIASTDRGWIYCFDGEPAKTIAAEARPRPAVAEPPAEPDGIDYAAAAEEILRTSGVRQGYCLDVGCQSGRLAVELAKRSRLQVYAVDPDPANVAAARRLVEAAKLFGERGKDGQDGPRVTVHEAELSDLPYPKWCANLVVSARALREGGDPLPQSELERIQRPYGGVLCVGQAGRLRARVRGPLQGAGSWTHQNSDAANTLCSADTIVKGPLEVFWFRDGNFEITDRHGQGPAPQCHRGCLVTGGVNGLCALDAYNGHTLWTCWLPGLLKDYDGVHHDVGVGDTGGCFCLSDDSVYVKQADHCLRIELASGRRLAQFQTPPAPDGKNRAWGYLATDGGLLFGTVANEAHTVSPRYDSLKLTTESVLLFAMDAADGRLKWRYEPQESIRNNAIAVSGGRVYLIDRPLAMADRITELPPDGKHRPLLKPGEQPGGVLVALDAASGRVLWKQTENIWGTQLAVSPEHQVIVMYYLAVKHKFFKLPSEVGGRIAAFRAATGERLWDREATYVTRPIINGKTIYAEGGAWDLETGQPVPFELKRSYGCGQISASRNLMLFRSATLGYYDLTRDAGVENFGGARPGCWFNAVPAGGLVLVPDGSSKCACSYQMHAWFALEAKNP